MARVEIDSAQLDPVTFDRLARSELQRLEAEEAESRLRVAAWDDEDAAASIDHETRAGREAIAQAAKVARDRISTAQRSMTSHITRAAQPGLSAQEQQAEESLALAAFRRQSEWQELRAQIETRASVSEPPIYRRNGQHSWLLDVAAQLNPAGPDYRAAVDRLERYGKHLARDFGKEGLRARKIWRDATRKPEELRSVSDREFRAMSTGSSSGGALVAPIYAVDDYATYRSAAPTFWQYVTTPRLLPAYGMTVNVPRFTGPGAVTASTENVAPGETDPTGTYATQAIGMYTGVVTASQQLHDRGGPLDFDSAIYAQLRQQLDANVDLAVITLALAGAASITRAAALTLPLFLSDLAKSNVALQTTVGTRLPPSAITAPAGIGEWLLAQTTTGGDSWFKPSLGMQRTDDGVTGQAVSGVPLLLDDNIPTSGSNAQLLVANKGALFVYAGEPMLDVLQEGGLAGQLSTVYRLRQYVAPAARFPSGVAVVSGASYPASPTFA